MPDSPQKQNKAIGIPMALSFKIIYSTTQRESFNYFIPVANLWLCSTHNVSLVVKESD